MEVERHVNLFDINKIHFIHDYLDKGWQVHIQKSRKNEEGNSQSNTSYRNRLVLKNMGDQTCCHETRKIILSDDDHSNGYGGLNSLDDSWLKENKKAACIYSFLHNTLRKGWIIKKQKDGKTKSHKSGTYCFSKPHKNQVKYLSQNYLQKFIVDNVNDDDMKTCFE
jgi:hypothetical protein